MTMTGISLTQDFNSIKKTIDISKKYGNASSVLQERKKFLGQQYQNRK